MPRKHPLASHRPSALDRLGLRLLAVLDDVARFEQHALRDLTPDRSAAQEELEIHAEVLELLALGVPHDRLRLRVFFHRQTLLVPADRFGLLRQRGAQARERPRTRRQLLGWLVVLVEAHWTSFPSVEMS